MQGSIKRLDYKTQIGINIITVCFSVTLSPTFIPKPEEIKKTIIKKYSHDLDLYENCDRILGELGKYCYQVSISPQLKGTKDSYVVTVKR